MSINRYNTARDANEAEIVDVLRASGLSVYFLDKPLDLLCGYNGHTALAEVKMTRNKRGDPKPYTPAQKRFLEAWKGGNTLPVTIEDALAFARSLKPRAA